MTRRPIHERAGTPLDHRFTKKVYVLRKRKRVEAGTIDTRQRVYQFATESLSTAVFWKHRLLVLGTDEWQQIRDEVEWIEYTDLGPNKVYRLHISIAKGEGRLVDGPAGQRYGIPLDLWEVEQGDRPEKDKPAVKRSTRRNPNADQGSLL